MDDKKDGDGRQRVMWSQTKPMMSKQMEILMTTDCFYALDSKVKQSMYVSKHKFYHNYKSKVDFEENFQHKRKIMTQKYISNEFI